MSITRHLEVIFCDDIREEVGNKLSFMGVYSADLTVALKVERKVVEKAAWSAA